MINIGDLVLIVSVGLKYMRANVKDIVLVVFCFKSREFNGGMVSVYFLLK